MKSDTLKEIKDVSHKVGKKLEIVGKAKFNYSYNPAFKDTLVNVMLVRHKKGILLFDEVYRKPLMSYYHDDKLRKEDYPKNFGPPQTDLAVLNKDFNSEQEEFNTEMIYALENDLRHETENLDLGLKQLANVLYDLSKFTDAIFNTSFIKSPDNSVIATTRIKRMAGLFSAAHEFGLELNINNGQLLDKMTIVHEICHVLDYYWTRSVGHTPSFLFLYGKLLEELLLNKDIIKTMLEQGMHLGEYNVNSRITRRCEEFYNKSNLGREFLWQNFQES